MEKKRQLLPVLRHLKQLILARRGAEVTRAEEEKLYRKLPDLVDAVKKAPTEKARKAVFVRECKKIIREFAG